MISILQSKVLWVCFFSWFLSQLIKLVINAVKKRKCDFGLFYKFGGGGMPSAHAAVVSTFATISYLEEGASLLFFTAFLLAIITVYDSIAFRKQLGEQAKIINKLNSKLNSKSKLQERLGHTLEESIAGIVLGIVIALIYY